MNNSNTEKIKTKSSFWRDRQGFRLSIYLYLLSVIIILSIGLLANESIQAIYDAFSFKYALILLGSSILGMLVATFAVLFEGILISILFNLISELFSPLSGNDDGNYRHRELKKEDIMKLVLVFHILMLLILVFHRFNIST